MDFCKLSNGVKMDCPPYTQSQPLPVRALVRPAYTPTGAVPLDSPRSCRSHPQAWRVLAHRPRPHPVYSPAPRTARAAPGCRAGTPDSSGPLQRPRKGLRRCPRPRPAPAARCPAAGYRRVLSRELRPGWSLRPRLRRSTGRIRSKWRWNLQTPGPTGAAEGAPEVRDRRLGLAGASGGTAGSLHSPLFKCHRVRSIRLSTGTGVTRRRNSYKLPLETLLSLC